MLNNDSIDRRHGAFLPHWTQDGATYFVTFRLADSLPKEVAKSFWNERNALLTKADRSDGPEREDLLAQIRNMITGKFDTLLDRGKGNRCLAIPEAADIVQTAFMHFDDDRYRVWAYCVMPNHVHVVVEPLKDHTLQSILHSWKSYTANRINKLCGTSGALWQPEYFDHLVRNQEGFEYFIQYTLENPAKASLKNWKWVGHRQMARRSSGFQPE